MSGLFDLEGKGVLVTGGNNGIGLGMADAVAEAGASVAIWGRNEARNAEAVERISRHGGSVMSFAVDVANEAQVAEAFAGTIEALGTVDAVFANAGVGSVGTRFEEMTAEEWRYIFGVNMEGVFFTFREAVKHMKPRGSGSLVVTSSLTGDLGMPRGEHYAATKAGVRAMIRGLAVEYGKYGIRANAISPGWVVTGMTDSFIESEPFSTAMIQRTPTGRFGQPDDFRGIAVYLASDASAWHTGDTITIDGGFLKK